MDSSIVETVQKFFEDVLEMFNSLKVFFEEIFGSFSE